MTFEEMFGDWARRANVADWQQQAKKHQHRCVYILECKGFYKIGKTADLGKRTKSLQTGNPFGVQAAHVIFTEENTKVERALHRIFDDSRTRDEWFSLSLRDLAMIKSMSVHQILTWADSLKKPAPDAQPVVPPDQMGFDW